jgi:hypothetical protein
MQPDGRAGITVASHIIRTRGDPTPANPLI